MTTGRSARSAAVMILDEVLGQGKPLSPEQMAEVETYVRTEFLTDFMAGRTNQAALERIIKRVTAYTGLDEAVVRQMGGRIDSRAFLRELYREQGKIASIYDSNVTTYDPFPWSGYQRAGDPILDAIIAPTTSARLALRSPQCVMAEGCIVCN